MLEFLGRRDAQLKIAGHRIEAGEVEAAIEAHPRVSRAAVVAAGARTSRRLAAFVVLTEPAAEPNEQERAEQPSPGSWLRPWLAERLAPYALPATTEVLAALPLTSNGKVDRPALSALAATAAAAGPGSAAGTPPQGELETRIAGLWNTVLPRPVPDRHVNFFAAGGDSLSAIRLVAAIERSLGVRIPVRTLLAAPTLAALGAEVLAAAATADHDTETGAL